MSARKDCPFHEIAQFVVATKVPVSVESQEIMCRCSGESCAIYDESRECCGLIAKTTIDTTDMKQIVEAIVRSAKVVGAEVRGA